MQYNILAALTLVQLFPNNFFKLLLYKIFLWFNAHKHIKGKN